MKTKCAVMAREGNAERSAAVVLGAVAERVGAAMSEEVNRFTCSAQENLGHLEEEITALARELVREALREGAQRKADATAPRCPQCGQVLKRQSDGHGRTFTTRAGDITVRRKRGYCPKCHKWRVAADQRRASSSRAFRSRQGLLQVCARHGLTCPCPIR